MAVATSDGKDAEKDQGGSGCSGVVRGGTKLRDAEDPVGVEGDGQGEDAS
jgi:hypothetical protein